MSAENTMHLLSARDRLQEELPAFLRERRWFGGKAQPIRAVEVMDVVPFDTTADRAYLLLARVEHYEEPGQTYFVPLVEAADVAAIPAGANGQPSPHMELPGEDSESILAYDATASPPFLSSLLSTMRENRSFRSQHGEVRGVSSHVLERLVADADGGLTPKLMRAEQSNTSVVYGDRLVLKLFRRVEEGINPDLEIGRFLTEKTDYRHVPLLSGYLEYAGDNGSSMSLGMLQSFVPNEGDAWEFTLQEVERYFERNRSQASSPPDVPAKSLLDLAADAIPEQPRQLIGWYLDSAQLLGKRTAELHVALSSSRGGSAFNPEPYSQADQRAFCDGALGLLQRNLRLLRQQKSSLPVDIHDQAQQVLDSEAELEGRFRHFEDRALTGLRTRIHGDYHLGQVLVSGDDFVLIDFEGEPARPLAERRRKQSPLQDVAGMLRSFHYAAYAPLLGARPQSAAASLSLDTFRPWAYFWKNWVSAAFLHSYFATAGAASFLSGDREEVAMILEAHLLEKAVYELGYELNNRPSWVRIPLSGIAQLTEGE
jgi:trehalose synthase-fused probable maltokinase